jgi:hypothetical protein
LCFLCPFCASCDPFPSLSLENSVGAVCDRTYFVDSRKDARS